MRSDMAKVIVERPRHKGGAWIKPKGYGKKLKGYGEDGPPRREGIRARWQGGCKYLNEHLGPLRRYLDSQLGRPWDEVFSEICAHIDRSNPVQDHVRDHVEQYVVRNVLLVDGVPCNGEGGRSYGKPLREMWGMCWYVCPRSGLLRKVKKAPKISRQPAKVIPPVSVRVSDTLQCRFFANKWHLVRLKPLPHAPGCRRLSLDRDVLLDKRVEDMTPTEARQQYGSAVYATVVRCLSRRELSQYPIPARWWDSPHRES